MLVNTEQVRLDTISEVRNINMVAATNLMPISGILSLVLIMIPKAQWLSCLKQSSQNHQWIPASAAKVIAVNWVLSQVHLEERNRC